MRNDSVKLFLNWTSGRGAMLFKDISYVKLWQPFYSAEPNHLCRHHKEQFCEIIYDLNQLSFKDINNLELCWHFCSAERNYLWNFGRGYQQTFLIIIFFSVSLYVKVPQVLKKKKCCLKIFLMWSCGSPFIRWSRTICTGIIGSNSVKLYYIWIGCRCKIFIISSSAGTFVQRSSTIREILVEGVNKHFWS